MNEKSQDELLLDSLTDAEAAPLIHRDALIISRAFEHTFPLVIEMVQEASNHLMKHLKELNNSSALNPDEKLAVDCSIDSASDLFAAIRCVLSAMRCVSAGIECENLMRNAEVLYRSDHTQLKLNIRAELTRFFEENQNAKEEIVAYRKALKMFAPDIIDGMNDLSPAVSAIYKSKIDFLLASGRKGGTGEENANQTGTGTIH